MNRDAVILDTVETQGEPHHSALIIVDVQNDFLHPDGFIGRNNMKGFLDMSLVPGMMKNTKQLLDAAVEANVLTVFVQMIGGIIHHSPAAIAQRRRIQGNDGEGSCHENTWGADFYGDVRPTGREREVIVQKHRYSAFWGTNLDQVLKSNGVKTMVMCGDATSGCVESTTRDGFMNDYYVITASDACADFDIARHTASLKKIDLSFGYVVPTQRIVDLWEQQSAASRQTESLGEQSKGHA